LILHTLVETTLWDYLIKAALEDKLLLVDMLDYAQLYSIELPSRLIKEIPDKMIIKDLKVRLSPALSDHLR